jgi:hypothetical protein
MLAHRKSIVAITARSQHAEIGLEHAANGHVADGPELMVLLGLRSGAAVEDIIKVALLNPVKDVTSNRGERIESSFRASDGFGQSRRQAAPNSRA